MNEDDLILEELILNGAVEIAGLDLETGEPLYNVTYKMKDINPELHNEFVNYFSQEAMTLWEFGFISMDVTSNDPVVRLTPKALKSEEVAQLDKNHQYTLKEIIRILKLK
jgi:hypothetical protein